MNNSTSARVLVFALSITSILFACLYLSERHALQRTQTARDLAGKSETELRGSVQAATARSDRQESPAGAPDNLKAVCGIYRFSIYEGEGREYDLRSDGTAMAFTESLGGYVGSGRDATWTVNDNIVTIGNSIFTIEGDDLTDSKGNRWVRMH
jgi:hypothetical protein